MKKTLLCLLFAFGVPFMSHATDLMDIYQQSLDNDPTFKQAYSTYMSSSESIPQARAALYPQVAFKGLIARNYENVVTAVGSLVSTYNRSEEHTYELQTLMRI